MVKSVLLAVAILAMISMTPNIADRRVKVENQTTPGKDVLRLEVVEAVNHEVSDKELVVCFKVAPIMGAKMGVECRLFAEYDGKPMRFDGGTARSGIDVELSKTGEDLLIARITVGANRGAGELQYLSAYVTDVTYTD